MKHIRKGIALGCVLALMLQLFVAFPAASADTVQVYRLVDRVEAGKTYVIVADDTYALNNKSVSYNNQDTLGSTAVAITNGVITSEVTEDMLWTVRTAAGVDAAIDGRDQYFIYDQAGQQLSRRSGSTGTAPLSIGAYDSSKPQYSTWSFADREADSAWTMYVNSYRDSDYPFTLRGAAGGFNAPGEQRSAWENDYKTYGSAVKFYELGDAEAGAGTEPEDPVDPAAGVKAGSTYVIVADGAYALTNNAVRYSEQNTLASVPVTVTDGAIVSDLSYAMLWTFQDAQGVQAALNGEAQYFIYDGDGKQLSRLSGSTGTAPIQVGEYDSSKPQYSTWSLHARADGSFTMYVNSYRDSDYYFALTGAAGGFNAPGKAQSGYDFSANGSSIVLYDVTDRLDEIEKPGEDPGPDTPPVDPSSVSYDALFLSDLHNGVGGYNGLKQMMAELKKEGVSPRVMSHGGDYVEDGKGGTVNWESQVYGVIHGTEADTYPSASTVYTMGNHDWESARNGGGQETMGVGRDQKEAEFKRIFGYDRAGLAYADDELEIYLIGAQNETGAGGGGESFIDSEIEAFDQYLASKVGSGKVIFLQTHWPAHSGYNFKQRTVGNADKLIDTMNKYAEELDIVFVWGHNHYEDVMRYEVKQPGDEIMYSADTSRSSFGNPVDPKLKTLKFTYVNAGCMNDMWYRHTGSNNTSAANNWRGPAACLSVAVDADTITFTYNRIKEVNGVWTYSHDANIDIRGTIHEHPSTVVVDRVTTDHEHEFEVKEVVEPTCTEGGYTVEQCKHCERTRTTDPTDALGHDWDEGKVTTEATTEHAGVMTYTCSRCGETKTERIPRIPGGGLADIDFTAEADSGKYEIAGQSQSAVEEGVGLALVATQGGIEPAKQNIAEADNDVVKIPVSGDWAATLKVGFDANGAANGYYQFFGFLASEGGDNQNLVGIRGGDGAMQDFIRKDGAITEETNSSAPGFSESGRDYYLRIVKEGDDYTCYRSDDGEEFTEMFAYEGTGIEADEILIDAYTGLTEGYKFTLKSLEFEGGAAPGGDGWVLADSIEAGKTYVVVADGQYAMTNEAVPGKETYADSGTTMGARAVTVEDCAITSEVDDAMLWTFTEYDGAAAYDGQDQYYIQDADGKYLRRGSMSSRNGALILEDGNSAGKPRYYAWSFKPYEDEEAAYAMYVNSENAYGTDYPGRVGGNASGFDLPSTLEQRSDADPFAFMNDGVCSKITLYTNGTAPTPPRAVDKTALNAAIASAEAVEKDKYTDESVAALESALTAAKAALSASTQAAVDQAASALNAAIAALVEKPDEPPAVNKDALNQAIADAEKIDKTKYTDESVAALEAVLASAKAVQADGAATQDAVDAAAKAVNDAIAALEEKPLIDKSELDKAISAGALYDENDYTSESYAPLAEALAAAKAVQAKEDATQDEVDAAVEALKDVVDKLEKKPDVEPFRFDDVKDEGKFYFTPVYWAYEAEPQITNGKTATLFGPDDGCTRGQVVTFLWRAAGCPEPKSAETPFTDLKEGGFYTQSALNTLHGASSTLVASDGATAEINGEVVENIETTACDDGLMVLYSTAKDAYFSSTDAGAATVATENFDENTERAIIRSLYLRKLTAAGWGTAQPLQTVIDFDSCTSDTVDFVGLKDGVYAGGALSGEAHVDPYFSNLKFVQADLDGTGAQTVALYEMGGNTYLLRAADLNALLHGGSATARPIFSETTGTDVTIGSDGEQMAVVYTSPMVSSLSNAIYTAWWDAAEGGWGSPTILAMRNLQVYEDAVKYDIDPETLEKIYLGVDGAETPDGNHGSMQRLTFSDLQMSAVRQTGDGGKSKLLVLTQGSLVDLAERPFTPDPDSDKKIVIADPAKTPDVGFYAIAFGEGDQALGEGNLGLASYDFTIGSTLIGEVNFVNTGTTAIRASDANPAKARLMVDTESGDMELLEWNICESIPSGGASRTCFETLPLTKTLPTGSTFYLELSEDETYFKEQAFSGRLDDLLTVEEKVELSFGDYEATLQRIQGDTAYLDLNATVLNNGNKTADEVFIQFSYADKDEEGNTVYHPVDITGSELITNEQQAIKRRAAVREDYKNGVYLLKGSDGTTLKNQYGRDVQGTLAVPVSCFVSKEDFTGLHLKAEIYSSEDSPDLIEGVYTSSHEEYNESNNSCEAAIKHQTFFNVPSAISTALGNTLTLPVSHVSTSKNSDIVVTEISDGTPDWSPRMGLCYYDMSRNVIVAAPNSVAADLIEDGQIPTGILQIEDLSTNSIEAIAYQVTELGSGVNIFRDDKSFRFCEPDGSPTNVDASPSEEPGWTFETIVSSADWNGGKGKEIPMNADLSIANKVGASVSFDTVADTITLHFSGKVSVKSTLSETEEILTDSPATVSFGNDEGVQHTVTITALQAGTAIDRYTATYTLAPIPQADEESPQILWSRSFPDTASVMTGQSITMVCSILDSSGLQSVTVNGKPLSESSAIVLEQKDENWWQFTYTFRENVPLYVRAYDLSGKTSSSVVNVDWFNDVLSGGASAYAPSLTAASLVFTDDGGSAVGSGALENAPWLKSTYTPGPGETISAHRFLYGAFAADAMPAADDGRWKIAANGYYLVKVKADDGSWAQAVTGLDTLELDEPQLDVTVGNRTLNIVASDNKRIASLTVNGYPLSADSKNISVRFPIRCSGNYTVAIADDAGNTAEATVTADLPLRLAETSVTADVHCAGGKVTGTVHVDPAGVSGGAYLPGESDPSKNVYVNHYSVALAAEGTNVNAIPDNQFVSLTDTICTFSDLAAGNYTLCLRDSAGRRIAGTRPIELVHPESAWKKVTYEWSTDLSTVTAARVCSLDVSHFEIETVKTKYVIINPATATHAGEGAYVATFKNPAFKEQRLTVVIPSSDHPDFRFDDVRDGSKFYFTPVYWAYEHTPQITNGMDEIHFAPDDGCTRGQVVTFLWRAAGCPEPENKQTPFTDVSPTAFYATAVAWAVENGITNGMSKTSFAPGTKCTRGQIVTFLWRFKNTPAPESASTPFIDVKDGAFYATAVAWAVEQKITNGMTPTTFAPDNTCTRGQVVTFLYRATAE